MGGGTAAHALVGAAVAPVLQVHDALGGLYLGHHRRVRPGVREQDRLVLDQDVRVDEAGAADRTEPGGVAALEDRHEPGDAALSELLVDDVCGFDPRLGPGLGSVVELHRQSGPADVDAGGRRRSRERAEHRSSRRSGDTSQGETSTVPPARRGHASARRLALFHPRVS